MNHIEQLKQQWLSKLPKFHVIELGDYYNKQYKYGFYVGHSYVRHIYIQYCAHNYDNWGWYFEDGGKRVNLEEHHEDTSMAFMSFEKESDMFEFQLVFEILEASEELRLEEVIRQTYTSPNVAK